MPTRKPKPDAWTLRQGDLPDERTIAREPRLEGLESNPVFRLILFLKRSKSWPLYFQSQPWMLLAIIWLVALIALRTGGGFLQSPRNFIYLIIVPMGESLYEWRPLAFEFFRRKRSGKGAIPASFQEGLDQAVVSAQIYSSAIWASAVTVREFRMAKISLGGTLALIWAELLFEGSLALLVPGILLVVLFVLAFQFSLLMYIPYHALPRALSSIKRSRAGIRRRRYPLRSLRRLLPVMARVFVMTLIGVGLFFGLAAQTEWLYRNLPFDLSTIPVLQMAGILVSVSAVLAGVVRGRYVRRHADRYFNEMTGQIGEILTWMRYQQGDTARSKAS